MLSSLQLHGRSRNREELHPMPASEEVAGLIERALRDARPALSEHDSKKVLGAYGIATVEEELVNDAAGAIAAAGRLGYPVVIKACSSYLAHKSDRGLVAVNVDDLTSVQTAIAGIAERAGDTPLEGYLVQRMLRGRREIIVGGTRDRLFGPCVMLGLGGILVEALADVVFRLAPLEERDAFEMIGEIRAQRLFDALRGEPAVDRAALSRVLMAVGQILVEHPDVAQVDVNPVIFDGALPVAVDALIALKQA
jgi:acetyl-CoA synthetase (ADP-forming)